MTTDFDPARHKIVAVVTDESGEHGQHFHLSLPDLVHEVREIETQVQMLPPEWEDRITAIERRATQNDLVAVEPLPSEIAKQWDAFKADFNRFKTSQEFVLPNAFAELIERVNKLESKPIEATDITPQPQVSEMVEKVVERIEALEDRGQAEADLYEMIAKLLRQVAALGRSIENNKARSDGQHGLVVDELSDLAGRIRRAS